MKMTYQKEDENWRCRFSKARGWNEGLRAFLSGSGRRRRSGKSGEAALRCLFARADLSGSAGERGTGHWVWVHVT